MSENNLEIAETYYTAMGKKDVAAMAPYLSQEVKFKGPLAETFGKEALLESVKHFCDFFKSLTIRAIASTNNQVMLAYNVECPQPIGTSRAVSLMTFQNNLITSIELFYDARPFETKKDQIFQNN